MIYVDNWQWIKRTLGSRFIRAYLRRRVVSQHGFRVADAAQAPSLLERVLLLFLSVLLRKGEERSLTRDPDRMAFVRPIRFAGV